MSTDRRTLLAGLAAGVTASILAGCSGSPTPGASITPVPPLTPTPTPPLTALPPSPSAPPEFSATSSFTTQPLPRPFATTIPAAGRQVAITIDDGVDPEIVMGYAKLCRETGMRLTFFANGVYDSWREAKPVLGPLVDSGQIVIANHTYNHKALTTLSNKSIAFEMRTNEKVLGKLYGPSMRPFMRPPYGYHNARVRRSLADLGYPGVVMWYGTLGDDQVITPKAIMDNARLWVQPGRMVIGHANHPSISKCYDDLVLLINQRNLRTVTVADVFTH